ncbi:Glycerate dehydrogenase [Posidoniimonas polymericola]|uniref:Glycerate dehydrogenase n=1 Tax=Posidoniimonas polymericola TaxID=2528002 RepID=A0A5C5XSX4_9BACT|nr:D-2-hydroxyacid dehydrogenase [Posidoniimonas polymericola]TWT66347.1 Glycerate dehydrogenase [Posidoniimonas polymericola]
MRIVLCYPVQPQHVARIQAAAADCEIVDAGQERIAELLPTADIYCGHAKVPVPWPEVVAAGRLKWIQSSAAGMDHCLTPEVIGTEIPVSSASGVLADQVADHTMALLLGLLRSIPEFVEAQKKREFIRLPTRDLCGAKVGIVGLGANGRRLTDVLAPFKTTMIATDYYPRDKPDCVAELLPHDALDQLLPACDIVILTAPLNDQTRGMIAAEQLAQMKPGAVLVNVARGPLVVESDLVDALESGHLGGAAVDVTEIEPLPQDSRLWDAPNTLITPHVGGQKASRIDDMTDLFCLNLKRYFAGERLVNLVDKRLGFPTPEDSLRTFMRNCI